MILRNHCDSPPSEEGWTRPQENIAERHPLKGADGVVRNLSDHPVCASKVASQLFLIAQPPLLWRRGIVALRCLANPGSAFLQITNNFIIEVWQMPHLFPAGEWTPINHGPGALRTEYRNCGQLLEGCEIQIDSEVARPRARCRIGFSGGRKSLAKELMSCHTPTSGDLSSF